MVALAVGVQAWPLTVRPATIDEGGLGLLADARAIALGEALGEPLVLRVPGVVRAGGGGLMSLPLRLLLAPVVGGVEDSAADMVRAAGVFQAVWQAVFAGLLVVFGWRRVGGVAAVGLGVAAAVAPVFLEPALLMAPGGGLLLTLLLGGLLTAGRLGRVAGAGAMTGVLCGLAGLVDGSGLLLGPAVLLAAAVRRDGTLVAAAIACAVGVAVTGGVLAACATMMAPPSPLAAFAGGAVWPRAPLEAVMGQVLALWCWPVPGDEAGWRLVAGAALGGLAAVGLGRAVWRGAGAPEMLAVLLLGAAAGPALERESGVAGLALSMLAAVYSVAGGRVLGGVLGRAGGTARRLWGGWAGGVAVMTVVLGVAVGGAAEAMRAGRAGAPFDAVMVEAYRRIPLLLGANTLVLTDRPRAMAFFTGRPAAALDSPGSDPAFWSLVAALRATHVVLSAAQPEVRALVQAEGFGTDRAGLTRALTVYAKAFFGADAKGFIALDDPGPWQVWKMLGPGPDGGAR